MKTTEIEKPLCTAFANNAFGRCSRNATTGSKYCAQHARTYAEREQRRAEWRAARAARVGDTAK